MPLFLLLLNVDQAFLTPATNAPAPPNTKLLTGSISEYGINSFSRYIITLRLPFTRNDSNKLLVQNIIFTILASVDQKMFLFLLLATLFAQSLALQAQPPQPTSHITVQGSVFCDACHNDTFSRHSYFLPGVEVHIQCKLKTNAPRTTEEMDFSVNRTTDRYGVYKLDIPSVERIDCIEEPDFQPFCEASLKGSSSSTCNIPGLKSTTSDITLKSKQNNQRIYSMGALSYRPLARNATICGNKKMRLPYSFNSSNFFFYPYRNIPWPRLPQLPPLPTLPPLPSLPPLPQFPSFPFSPLPPLPSLPPLPPLPALPPLPPLPSLPPWPFPQPPNPRPPPSPSSTFPTPNFTPPLPLLSSPTPPASNNLGDSRTLTPHYPPAPPTNPQQQRP